MPKQPGKRSGHRTSPATEEQIFALYLVEQNYAEVARQTGVPHRTVIEVVKRLGGDELAEMRLTARAEIASCAVEAARKLIGGVTLDKLGVEGRSSVGAEAARAFEQLARGAAAIKSMDKDADAEAPPPNITVNAYCGPPPEIAHQDGAHDGAAPVAGCTLCAARASGASVVPGAAA